MGRLVKLIGTGIGLASEAVARRKASQGKQSSLSVDRGESSSAAAPRGPPRDDDTPPEYTELPEEQPERLIATGHAVPVDAKHRETNSPDEYQDEDTSSEKEDEEVWQLDEATTSLSVQSGDVPPQGIGSLVDAFMTTHTLPSYTNTKPQLPCPVILPQRRPRDKKHGFVRAYAPVLADVGINQTTFLDFLASFKEACKADKWLQVVNLAAMGAGAAPSLIAMGVSMAVQFAVGVAMEVQRLSRSNTFLGRMNEEFFKPRGVYCLIMTYKPSSSASHTRIDINQTISTYSNPASSKTKQTLRNLRKSSGKTYGELELPMSAPLVFPALDCIVDVDTEAQARTKGKWVADYFDRRAQARWEFQNPDSKLGLSPTNGKRPEFVNRFSDPDHAVNSGSLISLVTGGKLNTEPRRQRKRQARREYWDKMLGSESVQADKGGSARDRGIVTRYLVEDVLYLMIVNLPSDEETRARRRTVASESR